MKAIALLSGGLDSQLAICVIKNLGIEVEAVNFKTPFFGGGMKISEACDKLGVPLNTFDVSDEYMEILRHPQHGFGKNHNPCIDCHGFMLRKTGDYMKQAGANFMITGEVLGQRPMSQNRSSLDVVEKLSGYKGLVLRPLCAKHLRPTIPEMEGWVNRDDLLDIRGRTRTRQMELAEHYGVIDYPSPAGGCLLTVENFSQRLFRLFEMKPDTVASETELLKYGRHFIFDSRSILAVGRKHSENEALISVAIEGDYLLKVATHPGPTSLLRSFGPVQKSDIEQAARITARYSDAHDKPTASVKVWQPGQTESFMEVEPMDKDSMPLPV
ncbi:MAG: tRNA 4-thiouridine(8) synthase ThiI [Acidobacteriota bacterium]